MAKDHLNLSKFSALVSSRAKKVNNIGETQQVTAEMKIGVLLAGLLPEFKSEKNNILATPMAQLRWTDCIARLTDFAEENGYTDLTQGGAGGAKTFFTKGKGIWPDVT